LHYTHPGDSFQVKIDSLNNIQELCFYPDKVKTYRVERQKRYVYNEDSLKVLQSKQLDPFDFIERMDEYIIDTTYTYHTVIDSLPLIKEIGTCAGEIKTSLWQAMLDEGEQPQLTMELSQIFQWDIDFNIDPQKGDRFIVAYEKYTCDGDFIKYGNILTARYISKSYDRTAYRFVSQKEGSHYYDAEGKSFQKAFLKSPLNYVRITSHFGYRTHPITRKERFHNGVDYAAPYGTPVEATADGVVIHKGWKGGHPTVNGRTGGYGKTVMIRHSNGYKTLYGHLSSYGKIWVGKRVSQREVIGYVGSTGLSTGNHLHYTIYHHDRPINPLSLKNVSGPPVPENEMQQFKKQVEEYRDMIVGL
ncbi:MAG: M23 family metallopeptidase, partial [Candidatus Cloacimonadota bacterium]|nr:M23 family metallopeptidase [Candidatus Cloacimonadota bacterium]